MSGHTPEPLTIKGPSLGRIDNGVRHDPGDYAILDADGKIIGEAYSLVDYGKDGTRPAEANARLWAAAPALLSACEAALGTLVELSGLMSESEGITGWHLNGDIAAWGEFDLGRDDVLPKVKAAIAAARAVEP